MKHFRKDEVLEYLVCQIRKKLGNHLKQVILFGSRARGDDIQGSDYDCLVVVDSVSRNVREIIDEIVGEALYQYNAVISAFAISEERYHRQTYSPLLMNVTKEGIVL
jgi:predicted nucleotidyltransferase